MGWVSNSLHTVVLEVHFSSFFRVGCWGLTGCCELGCVFSEDTLSSEGVIEVNPGFWIVRAVLRWNVICFHQAMVSCHMLSELEEVIQYKLVPERREIIRQIWWERLQVSFIENPAYLTQPSLPSSCSTCASCIPTEAGLHSKQNTQSLFT